MPAERLRSQTNTRLSQVILRWLDSDDFDLKALLQENDSIWAHVTDCLESQAPTKAQSPAAQAVYAEIRRGLLVHFKACQRLDEALRDDDLEAGGAILALLKEGDEILANARAVIAQHAASLTREA